MKISISRLMVIIFLVAICSNVIASQEGKDSLRVDNLKIKLLLREGTDSPLSNGESVIITGIEPDADATRTTSRATLFIDNLIQFLKKNQLGYAVNKFTWSYADFTIEARVLMLPQEVQIDISLFDKKSQPITFSLPSLESQSFVALVETLQKSPIKKVESQKAEKRAGRFQKILLEYLTQLNEETKADLEGTTGQNSTISISPEINLQESFDSPSLKIALTVESALAVENFDDDTFNDIIKAVEGRREYSKERIKALTKG